MTAATSDVCRHGMNEGQYCASCENDWYDEHYPPRAERATIPALTPNELIRLTSHHAYWRDDDEPPSLQFIR
jgi:hypothetical protein